ncbi:hypothetical protein [Zavarzinia sp.]|uniref:hypothetical protein n=1 Tax=Zavarzinia sp. TaxID=2027920 RepID=UPI003568FEE9
MDLKDVLGDIEANRRNLHEDGSCSLMGGLTAPSWHIAMPSGRGPSTPSNRMASGKAGAVHDRISLVAREMIIEKSDIDLINYRFD